MPTPDATPTAKVAAGGLASQATVGLYLLAEHFGLTLEPELALAIGGWVAFAVGYFKKSRPDEPDR